MALVVLVFDLTGSGLGVARRNQRPARRAGRALARRLRHGGLPVDLQTLVPFEARGRAFAFYDVACNTAPLVSLALGGVIGEVTDIRAVYVGAGLLLFAAAAVGLTTTLQTSTQP